MPLQVQPVTPTIGAEISGINLQAPMSDDLYQTIRALFLEHLVLVFRDQDLSREQHKAFARRFAGLHIHPSKRNGMNEDDPEVFIVDTRPDALITNGEAWHSDISCEEVPPLASLLYVTLTPGNGGGDTMFANMYEAYNGLSARMKNMLTGLTAYHDGEIDLRNYGIRLKPGQTYPKASHPVIVKHPETGRPLLFVNGSFTSHIEGIPKWESDTLLQGLYTYVAKNPRIQCRVKWTPNTLVMWDNRSAQHHAILDYTGHARYGERVSVQDDNRPEIYV